MTVTMDSNAMDAILSEAGMRLEDDKATKEMQRSITKFASLLICPLCNKIFDRPATLAACGHTFCMNCIDAYASNHCDCPAEGCGMPISIVGSNGGSFRKMNLQMSQTIESLQIICKNLNQSEKDWWLSPATLQSIQEMKSSKINERKGAVDLQHEDEDEEMIDLQANEDDESCLLTDDEKEGQGADGNISEDDIM